MFTLEKKVLFSICNYWNLKVCGSEKFRQTIQLVLLDIVSKVHILLIENSVVFE